MDYGQISINEIDDDYFQHSAVRGVLRSVKRSIQNNSGRGNSTKHNSGNYNWDRHKYLEKVPDYFGPGKALYLYTQDEVNAFHGRNGNKAGTRTLSNKIRDFLGYDERAERNEALTAAQYAHGQNGTKKKYDLAKKNYDKTILGRLENFGATIRKGRQVIQRYLKTTLKEIRKKNQVETTIEEPKYVVNPSKDKRDINANKNWLSRRVHEYGGTVQAHAAELISEAERRIYVLEDLLLLDDPKQRYTREQLNDAILQYRREIAIIEYAAAEVDKEFEYNKKLEELKQ
jgi:hypothetical protein